VRFTNSQQAPGSVKPMREDRIGDTCEPSRRDDSRDIGQHPLDVDGLAFSADFIESWRPRIGAGELSWA